MLWLIYPVMFSERMLSSVLSPLVWHQVWCLFWQCSCILCWAPANLSVKTSFCLQNSSCANTSPIVLASRLTAAVSQGYYMKIWIQHFYKRGSLTHEDKKLNFPTIKNYPDFSHCGVHRACALETSAD